MLKFKRYFFAFFAALFLSGCGAQFYLLQVFGPDHYYIGAAQPAAEVSVPPEPGSPSDKKDFETLLDWQAKRTEADCAGANAQARADYDKFFGDISPFPAPLPPEASTILFHVYYDAGKTVRAAKKRFSRKRPFRRNKAIEPCLGRISGLSYPSGHATVSRLFALLLSDLDPSRRAAFMASADRAALNRVIGGVHHPSDIEAGKLLGNAIYAELLKEPSFRADLEKLKPLLKPQ
jgi:acid phosphatase (class A)